MIYLEDDMRERVVSLPPVWAFEGGMSYKVCVCMSVTLHGTGRTIIYTSSAGAILSVLHSVWFAMPPVPLYSQNDPFKI